MKRKKTVVFIDGENFRHKLDEVVAYKGKHLRDYDQHSVDVRKLITSALPYKYIQEWRYYASRLREYKEFPDTLKQSQKLIEKQRLFKTYLEQSGVSVIMAGNVRPHEIWKNRKRSIIFQEKGVDVRLAVDMLSYAYNKKMQRAILCSSDSDLQPVVHELRAMGIQVVYVAFAINPNKGMIYTSNEVYDIKNTDVIHILEGK